MASMDYAGRHRLVDLLCLAGKDIHRLGERTGNFPRNYVLSSVQEQTKMLLHGERGLAATPALQQQVCQGLVRVQKCCPVAEAAPTGIF